MNESGRNESSPTDDGNDIDSDNEDDNDDEDELNEQLRQRREKINNIRRRHFGRAIYIKKDIVGSFVPGYIYKVIMINRMVFYSCDNGIFGFNVKLPEWCMH